MTVVDSSDSSERRKKFDKEIVWLMFFITQNILPKITKKKFDKKVWKILYFTPIVIKNSMTQLFLYNFLFACDKNNVFYD